MGAWMQHDFFCKCTPLELDACKKLAWWIKSNNTINSEKGSIHCILIVLFQYKFQIEHSRKSYLLPWYKIISLKWFACVRNKLLYRTATVFRLLIGGEMSFLGFHKQACYFIMVWWNQPPHVSSHWKDHRQHWLICPYVIWICIFVWS